MRYFMRSTGYFSIKTRSSRGAEPLLLCFFAISAVYPLLNIQTWITEQEPMVAMADLYADIVLPEFTITPEQATSDWKPSCFKRSVLLIGEW